MTKVTVVLPAYNSASTLSRAIESVLAQTLDDIELIVVNDGSSDETTTVASSYEDEIVHLEHDKNRGGSVARNTGIRDSAGEYIAFLDADDEWKPTKLAKQVDLLESRTNDWVAAYCDYTSVRSGPTSSIRSFISRRGEGDYPKEGGNELIPYVFTTQFSLGGASTLLARRSTVEAIGGFDGSFERHQDWEFIVRLLKTGKIAYIDEKLVMKYASGSPTPSTLERAQRQYFEKFREEITELESQGYQITDIHRFRLAIAYCRAGHFRSSIRKIPKNQLHDTANLSRFVWAVGIGLKNWLKG